jgi:hypothetical protein
VYVWIECDSKTMYNLGKAQSSGAAAKAVATATEVAASRDRLIMQFVVASSHSAAEATLPLSALLPLSAASVGAAASGAIGASDATAAADLDSMSAIRLCVSISCN